MDLLIFTTLIFLKSQVDTNTRDENDNTPLHFASYNGHLEICKILVEDGAEKYPKNDSRVTTLDLAVLKGHWEVAAFFRNLRKRKFNSGNS